MLSSNQYVNAMKGVARRSRLPASQITYLSRVFTLPLLENRGVRAMLAARFCFAGPDENSVQATRSDIDNA
jgi:hypothetical protein